MNILEVICGRIYQLFDTVKVECAKPVSAKHLYFCGLLNILLSTILLFNKFNFDSVFSLSVVGSILMSIGLLWEIIVKLRELSEDNWISTVLFAIPSGAVVTAISVIVSEEVINEITKLDAELFVNSVRLISAIAIPFVIVFIFAAILFLVQPIIILTLFVRSLIRPLFAVFGVKPSEGAFRSDLYLLIRGLAAGFFSYHLFLFVGVVTDPSGNFINNKVKYLIAVSDHREYGPCRNVRANERFKFIDNENISVAYKSRFDGKIYLEVRKCTRKVTSQQRENASI